MKQLIIFTLMSGWMCSYGYAISKEDYFKLPFKERRNFRVIEGTYSPEYAIPREVTLSSETLRAINLEIQRRRFLYAKINIGKKHKELDVTRLENMNFIARYGKDPGILYPEAIVDYRELAGLHPNHFVGAKFMYKDYLEWKKSERGQPSLWTHPGADAHHLSTIIFFYNGHQMYREWDALYADYDNFWWKRMAISYCKKESNIKACVDKWLNTNTDHQDFLAEWKSIKNLAKTTKPKPLSVEIQHHEWFYSDKREEVLKALAYYHKHNVRFMLEKALKHKDPVIAAKAKEYLDDPAKAEEAANKEPAGDETKK